MNRLELKKLLDFIFDDEVSQADANQTYNDLLHAYIEAELDGEDAAAKFPALKAYMDGCPACQEEYEEVKALLLMGRQGMFVKPPQATFDFSYLPKEPTLWKVGRRAGKEVIELFTQLRIVLLQGKAAFEQLPNPLIPEWELAPAGRMSKSRRPSEPSVPVLSLPSPEHDLSLRLIVTPSESKEDQATLSIEVKQISSEQLINRARVTIRDAQYRTLESDFTGEEGRVDFTDVQPGSYVIEVKYQGKVRQLPITLGAEKVV